MTDRRLRILLVTTAVLLAPLIASASNPQPAFAVRVEGSGPAMILIRGFGLVRRGMG